MEIHRRAALVLSFSPFALIGLVALWYAWVNFMAGREANALLERLEENGYPTVIEELYPPVENPDDAMMQHPAMVAELALRDEERLNHIQAENYGHRIEGMAEYGLNRPNPAVEGFPDVRTYFDPVRHETQEEAARELLDALAPELARFDGLLEAFARPTAGWTVKRETAGPDEFDLIHTQGPFDVFRLARLAGEIALLHLVVGDPESAARMIDGQFQIHRHLSAPPHLLVNALISAVVFNEILGKIQHGIAHGVWEDRHLAAFDARLATLSPQSPFVQAMAGELTYFADHLRQMLAGKGNEAPDLLEGWDLDPDDIQERLREFRAAARPRGSSIRELIAALEWLHRDGLHDQGAPRTAFHFDEIQTFEQARHAVDGSNTFSSEMTAMVLENTASRYFEVKMSHALLRAGIALERHRLAHGVHPETLAALVPEFLTEVPPDPCDGQPLRYRRQRDGSPVVWSINLDGIDEGGKPHGNRQSGDRVWLTRPLENFEETDLRR